MTLHATRATVEMAQEIAEIGYRSWMEAYRGIVAQSILEDYTPLRRAEQLRRLIGVRPEEYYLFTLAQRPVGYAIIGPPQSQSASVHAGEIHALYFSPESWGKGYGAQAMDFCLARLREVGCEQVLLWVLAENKRARRFYEKHGFTQTGEEKEITLGTALREVCYCLSLSANR